MSDRDAHHFAEPDVTRRRFTAGSEVSSLLNADEVADLLRVTRGWVYAETRACRIPHCRFGRYVRYRREAVEAWIAEREAAAVGGSRAASAQARAVRIDRHL